MEGRYNTRSPAVKRLMREAQELSEPTDQYFAQPLEDNLFEWHFTVRGPLDSDFQNGIYHGRIILPPDYPMKPPSIIWLTPNGRFETNKKICLSISGHHPESWQPSWSIRTALLAIIGFMPSHPNGAIGSLDYKPEERKQLAKKSREWKCPSCGDIQNVLLEPTTEPSNTSQEAKDLAAQINFQGEKPKKSGEGSPAVTSESNVPIASTAAAASGTPSSQSTLPKSGDETKISSAPSPTAPPLVQPTAAPGLPTPTLQLTPHLPWAHTPAGMVQPPPVVGSAPAFPWGALPAGYASMVPRFPYPPSQQANSFTASLFPPSFMNMFPHLIPGMQPPPAAAGQDILTSPATCSLPRTTAPYVREQMVSPVNATRIASPASTSAESPDNASHSEPQQQDNLPHDGVLAELLNKVKRVGSENTQPPQSDASTSHLPPPIPQSDTATSPLPPPPKPDANERKICKAEIIGDSSLTEELIDLRSAHTDSEVSHSLQKKDSLKDLANADLSIQDMSVDGDDKSEAAADLPLDLPEGAQSRLPPDISTSSPTAGLTLRHRGGKTLRQQQSATAHLPSEVAEDTEPVTGALGSDRQRIEAFSGDSRPNLRPPPQFRLNQLAQTRGVIRDFATQDDLYQNQQHFYNVILAGLSLAVILLLLNRLIQIIINL